jgi:hypothetical protein
MRIGEEARKRKRRARCVANKKSNRHRTPEELIYTSSVSRFSCTYRQKMTGPATFSARGSARRLASDTRRTRGAIFRLFIVQFFFTSMVFVRQGYLSRLLAKFIPPPNALLIHGLRPHFSSKYFALAASNVAVDHAPKYMLETWFLSAHSLAHLAQFSRRHGDDVRPNDME